MPLFTQTKPCLQCHKEIREQGVFYLFHPKSQLCESCFRQYQPLLKTTKIYGVKTAIIYPYDETIKEQLYRLKGCYDYMLAPVFLDRYQCLLRLKYRGYTLVPAPSYSLDDQERGFNHVEAIFSSLQLPFLHLYAKSEATKQSDLSFQERSQVTKRIVLQSKPDLSNTKILLVDDVLTTGSTLRAMIDLLKPLKPKTVEVLVLSQTIFDENKTRAKQKHR